MFDTNFQVVDTNRKTAIIYCDQWVKIGAKVYKVLEKQFNDESMLMAKKGNYKPLPIDFIFHAHVGNRMSLDIIYEDSRFNLFNN